MKKCISFFVCILLSFSSMNIFAATEQTATQAQGQAHKVVDLHFFWSHHCRHCRVAHPFIDKLKAEYPWLKVHSYDTENPKNLEILEKMAKAQGQSANFVPVFFVCDKMIAGFSSAATTGAEIRQAIEACR